MQESAAFTVPTQEEERFDLIALFRGAVAVALECVLEQQVRELVGARRYERLSSRKDNRNGTYLRRLVTSLGSIEVAVPRSRENGAPVQVLGRYKRRTADVDRLLTEAYVRGVSTRGMGHVAQALMGEHVSRSAVSRVTASLEERVDALRSAPISQPFPYLFLDATFLDARWAKRVENVSALVAYGVALDGHRHLLGITIGPEESEESWTDLLRQLLDRGLSGVELVIADDHRGLTNAVRHMLPEAVVQRCIVHLERNVLAKVPQRLKARVGAEMRKILGADSLKQAKERLAAFAAGLGRQVPEALACLQNGFVAATRFFAFPKEHSSRIRSNNGLERLHGETKRRIRSAGAFPDRSSALRLVTAVAVNATAVWADRRYLDMTFFIKKHKQTIAAA
jgi:transposase-like protein